jgi:hypothetical protein
MSKCPSGPPAHPDDVVLIIDISANFINQDTWPSSVLDKPPDVPNALVEGTLWYSQVTRMIYQLGGWFSFNGFAEPGYIANIPQSAILEFAIDSKTWAKSASNPVNTGNEVERPGAANPCDAPSLNKSFIFEGYLQRRSDADYVNYTAVSGFKCKLLHDFFGGGVGAVLEDMLQLDTNIKNSPPTLSSLECLGSGVYWAWDERRNDPCPSR